MAVSKDNFASNLNPEQDASAFADKVEENLDEELLNGRVECKILTDCHFNAKWKCMGTEIEKDFLDLAHKKLLERYKKVGWTDILRNKNGSYLVFRVIK